MNLIWLNEHWFSCNCFAFLHFDIQMTMTMTMMIMTTMLLMLTTKTDRLVSVCEFEFVCMRALYDAVWRDAHVTFQTAIADWN